MLLNELLNELLNNARGSFYFHLTVHDSTRQCMTVWPSI